MFPSPHPSKTRQRAQDQQFSARKDSVADDFLTLAAKAQFNSKFMYWQKQQELQFAGLPPMPRSTPKIKLIIKSPSVQSSGSTSSNLEVTLPSNNGKRILPTSLSAISYENDESVLGTHKHVKSGRVHLLPLPKLSSSTKNCNEQRNQSFALHKSIEVNTQNSSICGESQSNNFDYQNTRLSRVLQKIKVRSRCSLKSFSAQRASQSTNTYTEESQQVLDKRTFQQDAEDETITKKVKKSTQDLLLKPSQVSEETLKKGSISTIPMLISPNASTIKKKSLKTALRYERCQTEHQSSSKREDLLPATEREEKDIKIFYHATADQQQSLGAVSSSARQRVNSSQYLSKEVQEGTESVPNKSFSRSSRAQLKSAVVKPMNDLLQKLSVMRKFQSKGARQVPQDSEQSKIKKHNLKSSAKAIIDLYLLQQRELLAAIEQRDLDTIVRFVSDLMEVAVEQQEMDFFIALLFMLGRYAIDVGLLDAGIFFLTQGLMTCDMGKRFVRKPDFFVEIARAAQRLQDYNSAVLLLKKALQYSWHARDIERELQVYDRIGLNYYYMGDVRTACFYHDRFVMGDTERLDSPNRLMSENDVIFYINMLPSHYLRFNRVFLVRLSLPMRNIFQDERDRMLQYTRTQKGLIMREHEEDLQANRSLVHELNYKQPDTTRIIEAQGEKEEGGEEEEVVGDGVAEEQENQRQKQQLHNAQAFLASALPMKRECYQDRINVDLEDKDTILQDIDDAVKLPQQKKQQAVHKRCDFNRDCRYKTANGLRLIQELLQTSEFRFELPTPFYSKLQTEAAERRERLKQYKKLPIDYLMERIKSHVIPPEILIRQRVRISLEKQAEDFKLINTRAREARERCQLKTQKNTLNTPDHQTYLCTLFEKIQRRAHSEQRGTSLKEIVALNQLTEEKLKKQALRDCEPLMLRHKYEAYLNECFKELLAKPINV